KRQTREAQAARNRQGKKEKYGPPMPDPRDREQDPPKSPEAPGKSPIDQALDSLRQAPPKSVEDKLLSPRESKREREKREEALRDLQQTAKGRAQYGRDQQGGNPGTGLRRQLEQAKDEAAEARRAAGRRTTQRVTETEAEVKRLEKRQTREAQAARNRQGKKEKYGPPMPDPRDREPTLSELLADGRLGLRSSAPDPLEPYVRPRDLTLAPAQPSSPKETTATPAPQGGQPPVARGPSKRELEVAELVRRHNERMAALRSRQAAEVQQKAAEAARVKAAEEQRQKDIDEYSRKHGKPNGSLSVCAGGNLQAFTGAAGDACLTGDSRGLGWSTDLDAGAGAGVSAGVGISVKGSSANIDEIPGESYAGSASVKAGPGGSVSASVTRDGKNFTTGYGVGIGFGGGAMAGVEYSQSGRLFDWPTLPSWEDLARYGAENPPGYGT
ncbi:hypothetical protein, partial [Amycolatopsis sp. MtRt-6]|uniref:hypothetical protein n=1 Tax=Amycolatopsis sp. MtRt-6 TaxID=2792782 RepID=UPI001A8CAD66